MAKDIKLIVLDLDGTLLDDEKKVTEETLRIIKEIKDKDVYIALATGRPFNSSYFVRESLDLMGRRDYTISNTGAFIRRNFDGKIISDHSLSKKEIKKILKYEEKTDLQIAVYTRDALYNNSEELNEAFKKDQEILKLPRLKFRKVDDIYSEVGRVNFMGDEAEVDKFLEKYKKDLEKHFFIMRNEAYSLEVLNKKAGKLNAVKSLAEMLDIKLDEVMYFGDGKNDLEIMKNAGIAVAMENAEEELKDNADEITDNNNEEGVAKYLKEYFSL